MISIKNVRKLLNGGKVRLIASIEISKEAAEKWYDASQKAPQFKDASYIVIDYVDHINSIEEIWFETDEQYELGVCSDRADAFVVAMIFYAMITEEDIYCENPVSEKLLFHLNDYLLPLLSFQSKTKLIRVIADPISEVTFNQGAVGTGMSCGIDSLASLYEYYETDIPERYRLTHLTFFNVGADKGYVPKMKKWDELEMIMKPFDDTMNIKKERARKIAEEKGLGFVFVESNQMMIYQGLFEESHLYRSASAVLFLQNYFSLYYLSSTGCLLDDYQPKLRIDPGHYEIGLIPYLSTENVQMECGGKAYNRVEKFRMIQDYPIARKYLNVCSDAVPCYKCTKDYRMLIVFDILQCAEKFKHLYPIAKNNQVRWKAYNWLLKSHSQDASAKVLWEYVKDKKISIPVKSYLKYYIWRILTLIGLRK